jgi:hypothetical protein
MSPTITRFVVEVSHPETPLRMRFTGREGEEEQ